MAERGAEDVAHVLDGAVGRAVLAQRVGAGGVVVRVRADLRRVERVVGPAVVEDELVPERVGVAVVAPLGDAEQVVVLLLDVAPALVHRGVGVVGRGAARRRAVGGGVEMPVRVPHQVVGVARAGGVDLDRRVGGEGVVERLDQRAARVRGLVHRGHAVLGEEQELALVGAAGDGDAAVLEVAVGVGEAPVQAVGGQRLGREVEAPRGRRLAPVDLQDRAVQEPLGAQPPLAVGLAHRGVRALREVEQVARLARLPEGRVGVELQAVGDVVAARARQPLGPGLDAGALERAPRPQRHLGKPPREVGHRVGAPVERDRVVVGDPDHVGVLGVEGQADDAAPRVVHALGDVEVALRREHLLGAVDDVARGLADRPAGDRARHRGHVQEGLVRRHLDRGVALPQAGVGGHLHRVVEGHRLPAAGRRSPGREGRGELLEVPRRRVGIAVAAAVLEAVDQHRVAREGLQIRRGRDRHLVEAPRGVGAVAHRRPRQGLVHPDRAIRQTLKERTPTIRHNSNIEHDVGRRIDPSRQHAVDDVERGRPRVGDGRRVREVGVILRCLEPVARRQVRQRADLQILHLGDRAALRGEGEEPVLDFDVGGHELRLVGRSRGEVGGELAFDVELVDAVVRSARVADRDRHLVPAIRHRHLPGRWRRERRMVEVSVAREPRIIGIEVHVQGACRQGAVVGQGPRSRALVDGDQGIGRAVDRRGLGPVRVDGRGFRHPAVALAVPAIAEPQEVVDEVARHLRRRAVLEVDLDGLGVGHGLLRRDLDAVDVGAGAAALGEGDGVEAGLQRQGDGEVDPVGEGAGAGAGDRHRLAAGLDGDGAIRGRGQADAHRVGARRIGGVGEGGLVLGRPVHVEIAQAVVVVVEPVAVLVVGQVGLVGRGLVDAPHQRAAVQVQHRELRGVDGRGRGSSRTDRRRRTESRRLSETERLTASEQIAFATNRLGVHLLHLSGIPIQTNLAVTPIEPANERDPNQLITESRKNEPSSTISTERPILAPIVTSRSSARRVPYRREQRPDAYQLQPPFPKSGLATSEPRPPMPEGDIRARQEPGRSRDDNANATPMVMTRQTQGPARSHRSTEKF
ncbi:hypothetical protein Rumeso_04096 [Rubellimicrobium mesophilum DSM 19309]|uniref:Uncharacterized protein n=1 Tax=Rubellimicrobium mesophilum DSM 19309 TaxID=442562 RepID=A0A017HJ80_9RHOB|nr:hypothetical protein Rumeso_04096 [Rubellimicrobium mesophilum DSM 19309]